MSQYQIYFTKSSTEAQQPRPQNTQFYVGESPGTALGNYSRGNFHTFFNKGLCEGKWDSKSKRDDYMALINKSAGEDIAFPAETHKEHQP